MSSNLGRMSMRETVRRVAIFGSLLSAVYAHATPADLDSSFGTNGMITFPAAAASTLFAPSSPTLAALQADGKLLVVVGIEQAVAGATNTSKISWQIRRYTSGGALDASFGIGGITTLSFDVDFTGFRGNDYPGGLALLPDGRFVIVGQSLGQCNLGCASSLVMARFNGNGTLDVSFGINGKVVTNTLLGADAVVLQSDGKIIVSGNQNIGRAQIWTVSLYRFNVDGTLDSSFSAAIACSGNGGFRLAPDGKVVLATAIPAAFANPVDNPGFCVTRLNADGTLDKTFGTQGKTVVKAGVNVTLGDLFVDAIGGTTVAGATTTAAAFRLSLGGTLDTRFGTGGIIETGAAAKFSAVTGDCSQRTLVAAQGPGSGVFSTARLTRAGLIDSAFAGTSNGYALMNAGNAPSPIQLLLRPNGRVVAIAVDRGLGTLTIAQLLGDAPCAGSTGAMVVEFYNTNLLGYFITADPNEAAAIDSGSAGAGWRRTGLSFKSGGSTSVCRFYGSLSPGPNSHFYTLGGPECIGLLQLQATTPSTERRWNFESLDFSSTPASAERTCPTATIPVYRAYNNGFALGIDSNHRITTSAAGLQEVVATGWRNEGVVMCAPQ